MAGKDRRTASGGDDVVKYYYPEDDKYDIYYDILMEAEMAGRDEEQLDNDN